MAWRLARSLTDLRNQVNLLAPQRSKKSDGAIGDIAHSSRASDHNPDSGGVVRALDLTDDPRGGLDALWLREALRESRDPRIKYLISEGEICNSRRVGATPAWAWRPYTGPNGHFHHLHISVHPGAVGDRPGAWNLTRNLGAPVRPSPPVDMEDEMSQEMIRSALHGLLKEAAEASTPTGRQVRDYLNRIITPSVVQGMWTAEFGSGDGRQSAAQRLALAAAPSAVQIDQSALTQLLAEAGGKYAVTITPKES